MKACVYARTSRVEKLHTTTKIEHQVAFCLDLARRENVTVDPEHIFTDIELTGDLPPSNWVEGDTPSRPALAALLAALEEQGVECVIVRRFEKLGTTSEVLVGLRDCFLEYGVTVLAVREVAEDPADPTTMFALSVLAPCVRFVPNAIPEQRERLKAKKQEEAARLRAKLARLEAEIADM